MSDFTITVGDCTDHQANLREAALDYAASLGAKDISIIIDNGAVRMPWLNSLALRYGPEWACDNYGDVRHVGGDGAVLVELAYQFVKRQVEGLPHRQDYDSPHWSRVADTAGAFRRRGFDLLIVASDKVPAHLIGAAGAKHVLALGAVPEPSWQARAAIFPGISAFAAEPILLKIPGELWRPDELARQLRTIADQFHPAANA